MPKQCRSGHTLGAAPRRAGRTLGELLSVVALLATLSSALLGRVCPPAPVAAPPRASQEAALQAWLATPVRR